MERQRYRKKEQIEVIGIHHETGARIVQNVGDESDRWMIPKDVFDRTYEKVGGDNLVCINTKQKSHE